MSQIGTPKHRKTAPGAQPPLPRPRLSRAPLSRAARHLAALTMAALLAGATGLVERGTAVADTYPKNADIDIIHYAFDLTLSDDNDRIRGETTLQVRFLRDGVTGFELDLVGKAEPSAETGMEVASVDELRRGPGGSRRESLNFAHAGDRLSIVLGGPASAGELRRFRIVYSGVPATGLIIGDNKHGDRTFFSDNWPNKARNWLPTIDHPYEKATSEMIVTAPDHYQVISNGLLVEETDLGDTAVGAGDGDASGGATAGARRGMRRTHWRQSVPIAPWLFVLGVARFAVDHFDEFDGKSLQTWVYAQDRDAGFYDFAVPTKQVLEFYSDLIGPYSYEKLANVQSNSVGGGMEAATAIFYGDDSVTGDRTVRWRNVIIHEIAHQWWGNAVTENDWDHVWLSEGFATYFTLVYRDFAYGREDFLEGLAGARQRIVDFYADNPDYRVVHDNLDDMSRVTNGMTYQKGAWFLHMLRGEMGEDAFWSGIREYYRLYRDGNASTDDFREVMENQDESVADLSGFFEQWLYQGGFLKLRGTWSWDAEQSRVVVELEQADENGYVFDMRIPLAITVPGGGGRRGGPRTLVRKISTPNSTNRSVQFIPLDAEPLEVALDPDHWVLMEAEFRRR